MQYSSLVFAIIVGYSSFLHAADVPGDQTTRAAVPVRLAYHRGTFETPGDTDWYRVSLTMGQDYHFGFALTESSHDGLVDQDDELSKATVRDAMAIEITAGYFDNDGQSPYSGISFQAPYTGNYFLALDDVLPSTPGFIYGITTDCADDMTTECVVTLGKLVKGTRFSLDDDEFYRIPLEPGISYTLEATGFYDVAYGIMGSDGGYVTTYRSIYVTTDRQIDTFQVPKADTYYLTIEGNNDPGSYSFTIRR